jgi:hypothetical protein
VFLTSVLDGVSDQLHTRPLYPQGKRPQYSFHRRLGGPQSRSGRGGEETKIAVSTEIRKPVVQPRSQSNYTLFPSHKSCKSWGFLRFNSALHFGHCRSDILEGLVITTHVSSVLFRFI